MSDDSAENPEAISDPDSESYDLVPGDQGPDGDLELDLPDAARSAAEAVTYDLAPGPSGEKPLDPYHHWLGIPPVEQPPHHYRLLGVSLFESDPEVLKAGALRQGHYVARFREGEYAQRSLKIGNDLKAALDCLLDPKRRAIYDATLRAELKKHQTALAPEPEPEDGLVVGVRDYLIAASRRLWVANVTLPAAYRALGEDVCERGLYRDRLESLHNEYDALLAKLDSATPPTGFATRMAGSVGLNWHQRKRRDLWCRLGRAAYLETQESGSPQESPPAGRPELLTGPIGAALDRIGACDTRIRQLSRVPKGRFLSPRVVAWIVLAFCGFLAIPLLRFLF